MATGSKSARMTPFDGDAFFTSAITAGRRARSAAAKPRRGAA